MKILRKILSKLRGEQDLNKLIRRGLIIGNNYTIMGGVIIDPSHCWHITIGDNVTLAPRVHILAHDASTKTFLGYTKIGNVSIGNRVFVGAGSIILPSVEIGDDVIIGSGSVVTKPIPSNSVAVGNPAKVICTLQDYLAKENLNMQNDNVFSSAYTVREDINQDKKQQMIKACKKYGKAYVE